MTAEQRRNAIPPIDTVGVRDLLGRVTDLLARLEATVDTSSGTGKDRARLNADRSRDLLFTAHLLDAARLEVLSQYHHHKGQADVPTVAMQEY